MLPVWKERTRLSGLYLCIRNAGADSLVPSGEVAASHHADSLRAVNAIDTPHPQQCRPPCTPFLAPRSEWFRPSGCLAGAAEALGWAQTMALITSGVLLVLILFRSLRL
jgi:hypothetical protein